ncbi:MAG: NfeD family protein [Spirochaetaceae bacterium]
MWGRLSFASVLLILILTSVPGQTASAQASDTSDDDPQAYVVPIHGPIDRPLSVYVTRGVERARAEEVSHLIFDIDTFGGRVDSALEITARIGSLSEVETVAYVRIRPEGTGVSWSAGAIIAMAADRIYMAPGTSMGAAAPIIQGPGGEQQAADEKTVSAVRTQMAALAEKNDHPVGIALAMVDEDVELLEAFVDGVPRAVTREELTELELEADDSDDAVVVGRTISEEGKLLSLTAGEMERYGVSSGSPEGLEALYESLGLAAERVLELTPDAADGIVSLLTGGGFTSILILVGLVALFLEITSPGFGIPGGVAIIAFALIFSSNFMLGRVGSLELLLFVAGLVLLLTEVFIIPGFGVAGISGIGLLVISLVLSMQGFVVPEFDWQWDRLNRNVLLVLANTVGAFILFGVLAYLFGRTNMFGRLTLAGTQDSTAGFTAQTDDVRERYLGRTGRAVTVLRPSGTAEIDDERVSVESDGEWIEAGSTVEVLRVDGNRIIVRKV